MIVPPLCGPLEAPRLTPRETHYGDVVNFRAPCPCGSGDTWWRASRADNALAKPVYDISCNHTEEAA